MQTNVLFLCRENACRSQMAQGFFNRTITNTLAVSAVKKPADKVYTIAIKVMKKVDINISQKKAKILTSKL
jgi:arsenate reductase